MTAVVVDRETFETVLNRYLDEIEAELRSVFEFEDWPALTRTDRERSYAPVERLQFLAVARRGNPSRNHRRYVSLVTTVL